MKQLKVYIVNSSWDYERMWQSKGHIVVASLEMADLVQFTGGADVSPELYGEKNVRSYCDANRDKNEQKIFSWCVENNKPMVGICRGGQFLNVMNGGKMWQHVDGHATGHTHSVVDQLTKKAYECTSTHHQMMRISHTEEVECVGVAGERLTTMKVNDKETINSYEFGSGDVEVLYYPTTHSLCFQPHPEFGAGECEDYYFLLIERYFGDL